MEHLTITKATGKQLLDSMNVLRMFCNFAWPIKLAIELRRFAQKFSAEHAIVAGLRDQVVEQYGHPNKTPKGLVIPGSFTLNESSPGAEEGLPRFNEILAQEIEIDHPKVVIELALAPSDARISPAHLELLEPFVSFQD